MEGRASASPARSHSGYFLMDSDVSNKHVLLKLYRPGMAASFGSFRRGKIEIMLFS